MAQEHPPDWIQTAKRYLDESKRHTFTKRNLGAIMHELQTQEQVPDSLRRERFVEELCAGGELREVHLAPNADRPTAQGFTRYVWREASPYSLGLSLRTDSYLSHATAVFLHGLTDQLPKTVYVNKEQSPKPRSRGELTQEGIDRAFARSPRTSSYVFPWNGYRFVLLSGKQTGRLEVTQIRGPHAEILDVTKLERTLIDIVVRPMYAGGVYEVAQAFEAARDQISVNTLVATLKKLDYTYPYHQAIGFYMERADYKNKELDKLRSLGLEFDFYLTYQMPNKQYDETWRLYYPEGF